MEPSLNQPNPERKPEQSESLADASFSRDPELLGSVQPTWKIRTIDTPKALETFAKRLAQEGEFSVDTETWGPEGERMDRDLCLIQIGIPKKLGGHAVEGKGQVVLIDVVALTASAETKAKGGEVNPLAPLKAILEDKDIVKIVHHSQFESEQFAKYGIKLKGVVDTEAFAKQMRPDLFSYSLKACCLEILDIHLSKEEQKSDWHRRPLGQEQVNYAALDAEWTMRLYQELKKSDEALKINPKLGADELLRMVVESASERMRLLREAGIGNQVAMEDVRIDRLKEALRQKISEDLGPGEKAITHEGPFGSAKVGRRAQTEINVNKLKQEFPDIAEEIVYEAVKVKDIVDQLKDRGFDSQQIEDVMNRLRELVGYTKPSAEIWPKYGRIYDGTLDGH